MRSQEFITESLDQPYKILRWEKGDYGDVDAIARLPDGTFLSVMFTKGFSQETKEEAWSVEFFRNNSQEKTGEGDQQRVFATVLSAVQTFVSDRVPGAKGRYKPNKIFFSASKEVKPDEDQRKAMTRARLYDSLVQRYAKALGFRAFRADTGKQVMYELSRIKPVVAEGEVVPLGKKHRGDLDSVNSCSKCGGKLEGGTYMGQRIKVCLPCKQVYLPPNSGIDQQGNKIKEQGVAEDAKTTEHYNGIEISTEKEDDEIMVRAMMAGGRELGHVLFVIDGEYLAPQDLEVDERYQGQGIAATMYDYVKSKGYKIRRSGQQTDAGAGFWDKHKPGKNVWEQGVAEGKDFDRCFDQACKLYDRAVSKNLEPKLVQVADFQGDGNGADPRWMKLPQHVWQHYVVIVGDQVLDPTAKQFGDSMPTQYQVSDLDRLWGKQYLIRPRLGMAENFADGKKPGRKGLAKRVGVDCKQPVVKLRSIAANSSGEKQRMAHWCANMKSGKKK